MLGPPGVKQAASELADLEYQVFLSKNPDKRGISSLLRLNQGPDADIDLAVHKARPEVAKFSEKMTKGQLKVLDDIESRDSRYDDYRRTQGSAYAEVQRNRINANRDLNRISVELADNKALFSPKAIESIDRFIEGPRRGPSAGKVIPLSPEEKTSRVTTLGEMLIHPELFKLYPELKNIKVNFEDLKPNVLGSYDPLTRTIKIDPYQIRKARNSLGPDSENLYPVDEQPLDVMSTALHEAQHVIQDLDPTVQGLSRRVFEGSTNKYLEDLTGGANAITFHRIKHDIPSYVLEHIPFYRRFFKDKLYDPVRNYRKSTGEVFARSTADRRILSLRERVEESDPERMLAAVGVKSTAPTLGETPIGMVVSRIVSAEKEGLISPKMELKELDSVLKSILNDVDDHFKSEGVKKFRKGGEVPIPRTVDDHFLSYINPQEASALRAMGGGITASGGQRMMNGIPSFRPSDQAAEEAADAAAAEAASQIDTVSNRANFTGTPTQAQEDAAKDLDSVSNPRNTEVSPDLVGKDFVGDFMGSPDIDRAQRNLARAREKEKDDKAYAQAAYNSLMNRTRAALQEQKERDDLVEEQRERDRQKEQKERDEQLDTVSNPNFTTGPRGTLGGGGKNATFSWNPTVRIGIHPALPDSFSIPANLGLPSVIDGISKAIGGEADNTEDPEDPFGKKKGGEVKVPEKVSDHFLAYINPQEAAMLRRAGGGITALGGQKMKNGIPIFDPNEPGGINDPSTGVGPSQPSEPFGAGLAGEDEAIAEAISNMPTMEDVHEVGMVKGNLKDVMERDIDEFGPFGMMEQGFKAGLSGPQMIAGMKGENPRGIAAMAATHGMMAVNFVRAALGDPISGFSFAMGLPGLARDLGLQVDETTKEEDTDPDQGQRG